MSNYQSSEKFNSRPYRNILHDANSYNFNIVLRVFKLSQLEQIERNTPVEWERYDNTTVTLAATGGTHPFPNRWGTPGQLSDAFIKECTMTYPLGARGIGPDATGAVINLTIIEPNGMNFLSTALAAFNTVNNYTKDGLVGAFGEIPLLLSIYFGASNNVPGLEKTTRHIAVTIREVGVDITSSGTIYNLVLLSYSGKFNDAFYQSPLFERTTEIIGTNVGEYLGSLIAAMNRTETEKHKTQTTAGPGQKNVVLSFDTKAVGPEAEAFFASRLSSQIENGNDINSLPLNSVGELTTSTDTDTTTATAPSTAPSTVNTNARTLAEVNEKLKSIIAGKSFGGTPSPAVKKALDDAAKLEQLTGNEKDIFFKIAAAESSFNPKAANPTSSATGLFQFIDKTWNGYANRFGYASVSRANGATPSPTDPRLDPVKSARVGARFLRENINTLNAAGIPIDMNSVYAAHFFGAGTAARFFKLVKSIPGDRADVNFPEEARDNKGIFYKNVVGDTSVGATPAAQRKADYQRIRSIINLGYNDRQRTIVISAGMTFANVVERLLLNSEYALQALKDIDSTGAPPIIPWFKIYVTVKFGKYNPEANVLEKQLTFNVLGTEIVTSSPIALLDKNRDRVSRLVKERTIRAYNYLYTGKNSDVKNLEINLNTMASSTITAYSALMQLAASHANSTIGTGSQTATSNTTAEPRNPPGANGNVQSTITTLGANYGKGFSPDFNQTEKLFRTLIPNVFSSTNFGGSLHEVDIEIVGDPDLIPETETVLTESQLIEKYRAWSEEGNRGIAVTAPTGFSTQFFLLVIGNPDVAQRTNNLLSGYYVYKDIVVNFRESGEFTMNVKGNKFIMEVTTEEAKKAGDIYNQSIITRALESALPTFNIPGLDNSNNSTNGLLQGPKNGLNAALNNAFTNIPALKNPVTGG